MPTVSVRDIEIYYEIHGTGPPVLHLSGSGNDLRNGFASANPLNESFTGLHFDQRGLGRSTEGLNPPTMNDFADDAVALMDALDWPTAAAVGVSFGGMVAQHVVGRHPERISSLVLCCTSPGGAYASYPLHELSATDAEFRLALMDNRFDGDIDAVPGLRRIVEGMQAQAGGDPTPGMIAQLLARADHDALDLLADFDLPTLVCAGRYDGIASLANSELLAARIPGAELAVFEGGHPFMVQDPTAWTIIAEFLENHSE